MIRYYPDEFVSVATLIFNLFGKSMANDACFFCFNVFQESLLQCSDNFHSFFHCLHIQGDEMMVSLR